MYINSNIGQLSSLYSTNAVNNSSRTARSQKVRSFKDEMAISTEAQSYNELLKKLKATSDVRQDKVDEYSAQLENGSYYVSANDIATKMLSFSF